MVCTDCREAGNTARAVTAQPAAVRGGAASSQLAQAMAGHGKCKGGTWCDCTHQAPSQGTGRP